MNICVQVTFLLNLWIESVFIFCCIFLYNTVISRADTLPFATFTKSNYFSSPLVQNTPDNWTENEIWRQNLEKLLLSYLLRRYKRSLPVNFKVRGNTISLVSFGVSSYRGKKTANVKSYYMRQCISCDKNVLEAIAF